MPGKLNALWVVFALFLISMPASAQDAANAPDPTADLVNSLLDDLDKKDAEKAETPSPAPAETETKPEDKPPVVEPVVEMKPKEEPVKKEKTPPEPPKSAESEKTPVDPDEVVVTANRDREDRFRSNRSVSVTTYRNLREQSPRTTPEALYESPGTFVQETNYGGGSPIIRGLVGPQVLIMADGVRLNNSVYRTGPLQYFNLLDPYAIERVETLRGPGSVLYGSDAVGGVIQVFPLTPRDFRASPGFDGGAFGGMRSSLADRGMTYHTHFDAGYDGFSMLGGVTYKTFANLDGGGSVGRQPYSAYDQWSANGSFVYRFSEGFFEDWSVKVGYLLASMKDVGRADKLDRNPPQGQVYDNDDNLVYARLNMIFAPINTSGALTLSFQNFFERKITKKVEEDLKSIISATKDETTVNTFGADLQMTTRILKDRMRFRYGGMWYHDNISADRYEKAFAVLPWDKLAAQNFPDDSSYDLYGLFLMMEGEPLITSGGHALKLSGGSRLHGTMAYAPAQERAGTIEADFSHLGVVFQGGIQYYYKDMVTTAFTYSQGFRSPNMQEAGMLGNTGDDYHIPNNGLSPEIADTFELLARYQGYGFRASLSGYYTLLRDIIKRENTTYNGLEEIDSLPVRHNVNGDQGELIGVEGEASYDIGWGVSVNGHFTYTYGREKVDGGYEPLSKIPPLFGQFTLRYDMENVKDYKFFAETYLRGAAKQDRLSPKDKTDNRIPEGGTPAWWTLNVRTGLVANDFIRLGLAFENLFDAKYKYHASGVWAPGFNMLANVEIFY